MRTYEEIKAEFEAVRAVNVASRMESSGEPGRVHITEAVAKVLSEAHIVPRGPLEIKGKGTMNTYWLRSPST